MAYTEKTVKARDLRSGDKVLSSPAVSWTVFRVVADGTGSSDVLVISTTNGAHYYDPDQSIKIRRDSAFCAHCSSGWQCGGTGPVFHGWCPRHPERKPAGTSMRRGA